MVYQIKYFFNSEEETGEDIDPLLDISNYHANVSCTTRIWTLISLFSTLIFVIGLAFGLLCANGVGICKSQPLYQSKYHLLIKIFLMTYKVTPLEWDKL